MKGKLIRRLRHLWDRLLLAATRHRRRQSRASEELGSTSYASKDEELAVQLLRSLPAIEPPEELRQQLLAQARFYAEVYRKEASISGSLLQPIWYPRWVLGSMLAVISVSLLAQLWTGPLSTSFGFSLPKSSRAQVIERLDKTIAQAYARTRLSYEEFLVKSGIRPTVEDLLDAWRELRENDEGSVDGASG